MRRLAACVVLLVLTGCSSHSSATRTSGTTAAGVSATFSATTASVPVAPTSTSPATSTAPAEVSTSAVVADAGNPVKGTDLCGLLKKHAPEAASAGPPTGAVLFVTNIASELVNAFPAEKARTAKDFDAAATITCPALRASILKALGKASFDAAFNG